MASTASNNEIQQKPLIPPLPSTQELQDMDDLINGTEFDLLHNQISKGTPPNNIFSLVNKENITDNSMFFDPTTMQWKGNEDDLDVFRDIDNI